MPESSLTLAQQLALCQQVARLVRGKLPIAGELSRLIDHESGRMASAAQSVDGQLVSGCPLADAIAGDASRNSRMLSACIEVGEQAGKLEQTLEAWTEMHLACSRYSKALRVALVYPSLLILVMLLSLGYIVWQLIPEYRATYAQFNAELPVWLEWLIAIREQLGFLLLVLLVTAVAPLIGWYWRRKSFDASGLPRDVPRRLRVQVLAAEVLKSGVEGGLPLTRLVPLSVQGSGGDAGAVERSLALVRQQKLVPQWARETSMLITLLHAGLLSPFETSRHLLQVADALRQQADDRAASAARWLPMLVALTIGGLTILTYVFLIYLPWILLLMRIVER